MTAIEDRVEADLAVGLGAELIAELETLIGRHPGYERLWGQLMTALYRAGRQADALSTYQRARAALVEVSGVEPSPALQAMQRHVPDQDPGLLPAPAPVTAAPPDPADAARPAQLPPPIAAFSGRTGELAVLDALPEAARQGMPIAVIAGVAGVGKTALAVHWAARVRDRFVDGQLYVNLRGHARPRRCDRWRPSPVSCRRSAYAPIRSRPTWIARPRSTAPRSPIGGCSWCSTTRAPPSRYGRCCPEALAAS